MSDEDRKNEYHYILNSCPQTLSAYYIPGTWNTLRVNAGDVSSTEPRVYFRYHPAPPKKLHFPPHDWNQLLCRQSLLTLRVQRVKHSQLVALSLTSILHHKMALTCWAPLQRLPSPNASGRGASLVRPRPMGERGARGGSFPSRECGCPTVPGEEKAPSRDQISFH